MFAVMSMEINSNGQSAETTLDTSDLPGLPEIRVAKCVFASSVQESRGNSCVTPVVFYLEDQAEALVACDAAKQAAVFASVSNPIPPHDNPRTIEISARLSTRGYAFISERRDGTNYLTSIGSYAIEPGSRSTLTLPSCKGAATVSFLFLSTSLSGDSIEPDRGLLNIVEVKVAESKLAAKPDVQTFD